MSPRPWARRSSPKRSRVRCAFPSAPSCGCEEWGAQRLTGGAAGSAQGVEYVFGVVGYPIIELGTEIQKVPGM